jgi:hypothetical protein
VRNLIFIIIFIGISKIHAQELNCLVIVDSEQIQNSNTQVYTTLQNEITEYLNNTKWTLQNYKNQEKINCAITFYITEQSSSNEFKGNLQVQVSRPVFNSTYQTSVLNYIDNDLTFTYNEFEPLIYNENSFDSNLVSLLTYYAYTILGVDADSFAYKGGEKYFKEAENVVNLAQQGGFSGWNRIDGANTRYQLNENILSPVYQDYRKVMYEYHINGLDIMQNNKKDAKKNIAETLISLQNIYNRRANALLLRVFMDTKSDEIVDLFSDGPRVNSNILKEVLLKIYPTFNSKWEKIKF